MNDSTNQKPISAFDEICMLTEQTMRSMNLETLQDLKKQAQRELQRADIAVRSLTTVIREKLGSEEKSNEADA